jgi:ABC-type uncharacterized transport system auxiliary subunit
MIKIFTALFITLFFVSCATVQPHVEEYRIAPQVQLKQFKAQECRENSIKVGQTFSSNLLMSMDMNYGVGSYQLDTFNQSQWALSPNRAINMAISEMLRDTKLFKNVQIAKSRSKTDFYLESNIEDFMQYFSEDKKQSFVNVRISMSLIDRKTSQVLATKIFSKKLPTKELNAASGVIELNKALQDVLSQSALWFEGVCQ